ncbi:signal peptidase I [Sporichthya sp.]|uniref:signal peptidase I n=1 Tax=Sporichthya sp. TaxID=65475 RepID=UPI0025DCD82F|nr:signal peptidase I [Sporichthya sp.]
MSDPAAPVGPGDPDEPTEGSEPRGADDAYAADSDAPESADPAEVLPPPPSRRAMRRGEEDPAEAEAGQRRVGQSSSLMRELPILVFVALALALLIKTFLVQAFFIPSDSMENTLLQGDRVLVNKFASHFGDVKRGEVVVFRDPGGWLPATNDDGGGNPISKGLKDVFVFVGLLPSSSEKDLIKRVIGVPGDKIACCTNGKVTVNGIELEEPYIYPGDKPSDRQFSVTVPPNRLWVMGDHRSLSADSRVHMTDPGNGTIPADNVVGRAFVLVWPLGRWSTLGVPDTFKRKELDAAAVTTSSIGLVVLVPLALARRRRSGLVVHEHVDA